MQALWGDDEAAFTGDHVSIPPSWSWPKPVQVDAAGRRRSPSSWAAPPGRRCSPTSSSTPTAGCRSAAPACPRPSPRSGPPSPTPDRDPDGFEVVPFAAVPDHGKLDHYEGLGVTETVFDLPSAPRDEVLPILDRFAAMVAARR